MRSEKIKKIANLIKFAGWTDVESTVSISVSSFLSKAGLKPEFKPEKPDDITKIILSDLGKNYDKIRSGASTVEGVLGNVSSGNSGTWFRNEKKIDTQAGYAELVESIRPIIMGNYSAPKTEPTKDTAPPKKPESKDSSSSRSKDSPDAWKVFGDKAEVVKSAWIKRSTKLGRFTTHQNFKLWLTKNNLAEKPENADTIISKLYADIGEPAPAATATSATPNATNAPASEAPKEEAKKEEAKPQAATEFTDKEKRLALALSAMGNQKLVGTKGFDLVRELPRINAIASFVGSWENMAKVIMKRNPSLGPSMPTDLGKDGVMIDKEYADKNLKWFQILQATINAVYESSEKKRGVISSIPGFTVKKEEPKDTAKADDGLKVKSSIKNREYRVSTIKRIIANS